MSNNQKILCLIRNERVILTPEESVRQQFLSFLIHEKSFPKGLISVETSLRHLVNLSDDSSLLVPDRRVDIVCFAKGSSSLYPLLLVECKSIKLTKKVVAQVMGYNHFVHAPYIAIVNESEIQFGWFDKEKKDYSFIKTVPDYKKLY